MKKTKSSPYAVFLFDGLREWFWIISVLFLILMVNLTLKYNEFLGLNFSKPQEIYAQVLFQYPKAKERILKNGDHKQENYFVLKLMDNNGNTFYGISKEDIKFIQNRYIRIYGQFRKCSFVEFMRSCFINIYSLSLLHKRDYRDKIRDFIDSQHKDSKGYLPTGNLYRALFIADPLDKLWRDISNKLGLAHIIAISGFHLGILSSFLYILFYPIYHYFQKNYFSYRNEAYDLGVLILCCMFAYLLLLDYQPSFFRSFVMAAVGFLVYYSGIRILSFSLLFIVFLFCLAFSPGLILNIGFILSISGVFYIFLFVKYFPKIHPIFYGICFNLAIFLNIAPIVHYFFPYFSPYQLISIPVGILFIIFFPLSLLLHFFGFGNIFNTYLLWSLKVNIPFIEYYTPIWIVLFYAALSLGAIFSRFFYLSMNCLSIGFFIFLFLRYL
ncbi:ComEC/Rec2 family competence protein [Helicobacter sp. 13S00477-4]|uniref:ComEC/Rec2 family competence protein n=1 Tax=Helicobacter sp. 13S00477-4 TaxID=1905759 RepID=UPI000BA6618B|nr:ComEC/Rec2 family competence protein [Helicobacter sp. 13S00477-4]PAF52118.1 hypothetical protein BKH44_04405 [Helicobacter sp. 13S00477-4]